MTEQTSKARELEDFWRLVIKTLEENDKDIPFALLYGVEEDEESISVSSSQSTRLPKQCVLKGGIGVPHDHPAAPKRIDLQESSEGFMPYLREAMDSNKPTMFRIDDGTLPERFMKDIQWLGFGDKCNSVVILRRCNNTSDLAQRI